MTTQPREPTTREKIEALRVAQYEAHLRAGGAEKIALLFDDFAEGWEATVFRAIREGVNIGGSEIMVIMWIGGMDPNGNPIAVPAGGRTNYVRK